MRPEIILVQASKSAVVDWPDHVSIVIEFSKAYIPVI